MSPHCKHLFAGLALVVCGLEAGCWLGLSLSLSLTGVLSAVGCLWRKQSGPEVDLKKAAEKATAAPSTTTVPPTDEPAPLPSAPAPDSEPSPPPPPSSEPSPHPAPSREPSQLPVPSSEPSTALPLASEPSAPTSLAPQGSTLLAGEVSFTFCNALAEDSSSTDGDCSGGSSTEGHTALGTVDEFGEDEGAGACCGGSSGDAFEDAEGAQDNDEFEDCCGELVFEPSSNGVPGLRMVPRGISGLAERTEPTSADQRGTPLLVSSYDSRLVEVVNGRVKAQAGVEPAYLSQPLSEVAHLPTQRSPSRSPSRSPRGRSGGALGPLASLNSFGSLSPVASSSAL